VAAATPAPVKKKKARQPYRLNNPLRRTAMSAKDCKLTLTQILLPVSLVAFTLFLMLAFQIDAKPA